MWQRHQLRTATTWKAPLGFRVATSFTAQSGTPGGPVVITTPYEGEYGPATLSIDGRTVSNPLATTYRFAYANRGIGQIWCPWLYQWNTLVGRQFRITERQSIEADLNVYNILNGAAAQQFVNGNNKTSSTFGSLQNIQVPRSAQISLRYSF
jgi:hypothetical protein